MERTPLTRLELDDFTAFERLELSLSPRFNVFVGTNGTGKTHLLKVLYAAGTSTQRVADFERKLVGVFKPHGDLLARLIRRNRRGQAQLIVHREQAVASLAFSMEMPGVDSADEAQWEE